jgi:chorismate dehydratase
MIRPMMPMVKIVGLHRPIIIQMDQGPGNPGIEAAGATRPYRLGCVSFLNARPLIEGLEGRSDLDLRFDVPSRLLPDLEAGQVDVALCPVIDLQTSKADLEILPVGGIGCYGKTLTVRLFSRVPFPQIQSVSCDTDSHTSIVLMRVLLDHCYQIRPEIISHQLSESDYPTHDAMLLIGDKVVTHPPDDQVYIYQMDLGESWHQNMKLPFVFAVWMARRGTSLGDLPATLDQTRHLNTTDLKRLKELVERQAPKHGWPVELAQQYLGHWLRYDIGQIQLQAIELFFQKAHKLGLIEVCRPIHVRQCGDSPANPSLA